jgi:hypothetical protein
MKKFIVTTTINNPTEATLKFSTIADKKDFKFVIVGDLKTPHGMYEQLVSVCKNVIYLSPEKQEELYPELSQIIGWKTIQRRNIGFVYAYQNGADIVATVDDDNIPYESWGDNILIGNEVEVDEYENTSCPFFDSISTTEHNQLWHRGFPIEYLQVKNNIDYKGKTKIIPLVQAEFWDGDPDIDAICRLSKKPIVKFKHFDPFTTKQLTPFNSQNTFLHRSVLKYYSVFPYTGRMDDIWGSYVLQYHFPNSVIFNKSTVYQARNPQDLIKNLENEVIGYRGTLNLLENLKDYMSLLPEKTIEYFNIYQKYFNL